MTGPSIQKTEDSSSEVENCDAKFSCYKCSYETSIKWVFERHLVTHSNNCTTGSENQESGFKCDLCQSRFFYRRSLTLHMKLEHSLKMLFKCKQCPYSCGTNITLRLHNLSKHSGHPLTSIRKRLESVPLENSRAQSNCPSKTVVEGEFDRHVTRSDDKCTSASQKDKQFICDICLCRFAHQSTLTSHMRTVHWIRKQFKCILCNHIAQSNHYLKLHFMAKHTGEKPLKCDLCPYRCVQKVSLVDHFKTRHSGGEPFKCDRCLFETSQKDELIAHMTKTHLSKALNIT